MDPSTDISASRSWGGTLPGMRGIVCMSGVASAVLGDDHIDVGSHVAVQPQRDLVLAKRLDRLLHVDLVPIDVDSVLGLERCSDVLVCDRAERLVLGTNLQSPDHRLVVDLI